MLEDYLGKYTIQNLLTTVTFSIKQKPDVSCYCKVFIIIKIKLTFGKPETNLYSFFDIFMFIPFFLLLLLNYSLLPCAIGEVYMCICIYMCTFIHFINAYVYVCIYVQIIYLYT